MQCRNAKHGWPSIWRRRKWVSWRSVYSLLTNCSEMSLLGSYWETWYFVVCEQTCSCGHKMDEIMCQTFGAFDLLHSSHLWAQAMLSCGKHCTTMQVATVSGHWFCWRSWRLQIHIRRSLVYFRKSHVCANKLDVQETDFCFTQFYRSWGNFSRCKVTHGRYSRSHSLGFGDWSISFRTEQHRWTQERATEKPISNRQVKHA